jgi:uncharacterized sulfatase
MKYLFLIMLIGCTSYYQQEEEVYSEPENKNVLLIVVDELSIKVLNSYDYPLIWAKKPNTPNIDWLANNGLVYENHYATSPVCTASRAALFTGKTPRDIGVFINQDSIGNESTIAHDMLDKGYKTGYVGKWHLNGEETPGFNMNNHGFDNDSVMFNRGHFKQMKNVADTIFYSYDVDNENPHTYTTNYLTNKLINRLYGKSWFYVLSLPDPHGKNNVLSDYENRYLNLSYPDTVDNSSLPYWAQPEANIITQNGLSKYFGMVEMIDDNIGKILDHLRDSNELDNTIIIFTADHGDMLGEHHRDNKGVPFDGSAKIPLIVYGIGSGIVDGYSSNKEVRSMISEIHQGNYYTIPNSVVHTYMHDKWEAFIEDGIKTIYTPDEDTVVYNLVNDPMEYINVY